MPAHPPLTQTVSPHERTCTCTEWLTKLQLSVSKLYSPQPPLSQAICAHVAHQENEMSRQQQFFFISTIMLLFTGACQLSATPVTTPKPTEKPMQPATDLPVFTLPTSMVGAGNDLPTIFPILFSYRSQHSLSRHLIMPSPAWTRPDGMCIKMDMTIYPIQCSQSQHG